MEYLTQFLQWLFEFAFNGTSWGGFWRFIGVLLLIGQVTRITTLFKITFPKKKEDK